MKIGDRVSYAEDGRIGAIALLNSASAWVVWEHPSTFPGQWKLQHQLTVLTDKKPEPDVKLDLSKPVQTRGGQPVRILCTDAPGGRPIRGLVGERGYEWQLTGVYGTGKYADHLSHLDLVQVPPPPPATHKKWVVIFRSGTSIHTTTTLYDDIDKAKADWKTRMKRVIAFAPVEYTEG